MGERTRNIRGLDKDIRICRKYIWKARVICSKMEGAGSEMWRDPENRSQPQFRISILESDSAKWLKPDSYICTLSF